jgi:hypothetical protein
MRKTLSLSILALLLVVSTCKAADEIARKDKNSVPAIIGVNASDEIRRIHTDDDGALLTTATGTFTVAAATITVTMGSVRIWDGVDSVNVDNNGNLQVVQEELSTVDYYNASIAAGASATITLTAVSHTLTICNETTGTMYMKFGLTTVAAPALNDGMPIFPSACRIIENLYADTVRIYNVATGYYAIEGRR